eukprot:6407735-Karenia_brevis.AAC.1
MMVKHPDLHRGFVKLWHSVTAGGRCCRGPVRNALDAIKSLTWSWCSPFAIKTYDGRLMSYLEMPAKHWQHEVREALRHTL